MSRAAWRLPAFVLALATSLLVLLLWASGAEWRGPPLPAHERVFPGSRFQPAFGRATREGQQLQVEAAGEDHSALQVTQVPGLDASRFPVLRYRFRDFPRTLELSLVFRTAERPDDVRTLGLPWPGGGTGTVDLSRVAAWHGELVEIGFAQFATAHNVPAELGFRPFELVSAELWSPSWRGSLAALGDEWLGGWPWSQRSVHALGRENRAAHSQSMVVCAALAILVALGWAAVLLRLRGRQLGLALAVVAGMAWLGLDLRWQWSLGQRLLAARVLYADAADWPARSRLVGDSDILRAADELKALLEGEPPGTRILVQGGNGYETLRLEWHMLPLNVGLLAAALPHAHSIPDGSVIVFYQSDAWRRNPALRRLLAHSTRLRADADVVMAEGFEAEPLVVFRYRHDD
ncbi:MAG: hypothetical protein J0H15_10705 [Xanthomonadales bacterium]|nr:hypothetical protein [Xanthomonadales bacterium]